MSNEKFYHKKTWLGLVLIVEVNYDTCVNNGGYAVMENITEYRKARQSDLVSLPLRYNDINLPDSDKSRDGKIISLGD